jgi:hypothetical protein
MCDQLSSSYWSKRRRIHASVQAHIADLASCALGLEPLENYDRYVSAHIAAFSKPLHPLAEAVEPEEILSSCPGSPKLEVEQETTSFDYSADFDEFDRWSCYSDSRSGTDDATDSDSDLSDPMSDEYLTDDLASWATEFHIHPKAVGALLNLLRPFHPKLPKDGRTITRSGSSDVICVTPTAGGHYYHFGIQKCLQQLYDTGVINVVSDLQVSIQVNIDGLPLFKSSGCSFGLYLVW